MITTCVVANAAGSILAGICPAVDKEVLAVCEAALSAFEAVGADAMLSYVMTNSCNPVAS